MFSISTTLASVAAVFAAVAFPALGAVIERDCLQWGNLSLGKFNGTDLYISSTVSYEGNNIFMPVSYDQAGLFEWNKCDIGNGNGLNIYQHVSVWCFE